MKNKPLKDKQQIMYEDEYDNPCWVNSKEDCDYGKGRGKLFRNL